MIDEVYKVKTIDEAINILELKEDVGILNGGTDLIVNIRNNKSNKKKLVDISDISELKKIQIEGDVIKIGAGVTFKQIINSDKINKNLSGLKKAANSIGSPQIRSRATIGGNICNNSPSADIMPPLLALECKVILQSKDETRKVLLRDLLLDKNKINIKENELLTYIEINKLRENQSLGFSKLGYRKSLAIAKISASVYIDKEDNKFKDVKIALGALSNTAIRIYEAEKYLLGKEICKDNIKEALYILENRVSNNLKGRESEYFKSNAVSGVVEDAIEECLNDSERVKI
ncbi:FAD binding domain-containing protein [Romboutsia sp.]|uniref:FAD binding domain-containing protein n=1 Tax=Romboutsia sp. TaxID=1965302 RepID=UPI003F2DDAAC